MTHWPGTYALVALTRFLQGDLAGAETAFAQMERRCEKLRFPHGAFTLCYGRAMETWIRIEAGQFDRAAELIEEVARRGEQHGFDEWVDDRSVQRRLVGARTVAGRRRAEPAALQASYRNMTAVVDAWRAIGMKTFLAWYDAILARLLTAADMKGAARERVELALQMADETGMHFYDAELLRIRAHTLTTRMPSTRVFARPSSWPKPRAPRFSNYAPLQTISNSLASRPGRHWSTRLSRFPAEQTWPELARARALLG